MTPVNYIGKTLKYWHSLMKFILIHQFIMAHIYLLKFRQFCEV
jgi:hypothetical protein